jgi:hemolysin activation/secretion protein
MKRLHPLIHAAISLALAAFTAPAFAQAAAGASAAPAGAQSAFDVFEYRVLGNTLLTTREVESAVYPFLGSGKTIETVEEARKALEAVYRDRGFPSVFVDIPEQDVAEGVVRLRITEARLERVRATGARYYSQRKVLKQIPAARQGEVLSLPELREQLDDANRSANDRVVTPVLRAGPRPGTVDLDLKVTDNLPLHASVEVNDRYTANTARWRTSGSLSYDNLWQRSDSLALWYQTAPESPSDTSILSLSYTARLSPSHMLATYVLDTNSDIQAVGTLGVLGKGHVYGFRDVHTLPAEAGTSHNVSCGVDYKDYGDTIRIEPLPGSQSGGVATVDSGIGYVNFACQYSRAVAEGLTGGEFRWSLGTGFGLRGFGNGPAEFEAKRFKARPNYFKWTGSASQNFKLPAGLVFALAGDGQFAGEPLINNEQFAAGGMDTVRGYAESQQLGDYGYRLTGELQSGSLGESLWRRAGFDQFQLFAFMDHAQLYIRDPLPRQLANFTLASTGAGIRLNVFQRLSAQLYWALALEDNGVVRSGDTRWHFMMRMGF